METISLHFVSTFKTPVNIVNIYRSSQMATINFTLYAQAFNIMYIIKRLTTTDYKCNRPHQL